uniref:non-specific serine/threonine protein kinase n=1 Tax=Arcella intermedia TaxID=1963864 RepID=A0A6B2L7K7_9EUKA
MGEGAFGKVFLAREKKTKKYVAIKQIDKALAKHQGKDQHIKTEKTILTSHNSPFILRAVRAFQERPFAYLCLEFCPGGDIRTLLKAQDYLEEPIAKLYFAEMIMAVHELHLLGYIHRDLKPENFLIDKIGHIKLADFGLSKSKFLVGKVGSAPSSKSSSPQRAKSPLGENIPKTLQKFEVPKITPNTFWTVFKYAGDSVKPKEPKPVPVLRTLHKSELRKELGHSIVGSAEFMSPEVISGRMEGGSYYNVDCDWWSLGCVFFEMLAGSPPFTGDTPEELFTHIERWREFVPSMLEEIQTTFDLTPECISLLSGLLCDVSKRLGQDIDKLKNHPFFKGIDFSHLREIEFPFIPRQYPPELII